MTDWGNLAKEWGPFLKDVVRDGFLVYIAWSGLGTWRRQLVGTKQREAAATLLRAVYELQRTLRDARHPSWSLHEASDRPRSDAEERDGVTGSMRTEGDLRK